MHLLHGFNVAPEHVLERTGACLCQWHRSYRGPVHASHVSHTCTLCPSPACGARTCHTRCVSHMRPCCARHTPSHSSAPVLCVDSRAGPTCPRCSSARAPCTCKLDKRAVCPCLATVTHGLTRSLPGASRWVCWVCGSWPRALPRDSWRGVLAAGLLPGAHSLSGPVFPFRAPRPYPQPQTLGLSCPLPPSVPSSWHTLGLLETQHPSALLASQQASGASTPPPAARPPTDLADRP